MQVLDVLLNDILLALYFGEVRIGDSSARISFPRPFLASPLFSCRITLASSASLLTTQVDSSQIKDENN